MPKQRLIKTAPFIITTVLTDNGKAFSDRFCATGQRDPAGEHAFNKVCASKAIEHRLSKPRPPQTNGMIERFNDRIADVLHTTRFQSADQLHETLVRYAMLVKSRVQSEQP